MPQLPSETSIWSWLVKGIGGLCSLMEGYCEHGPRLTEEQYLELCKIVDRLDAIVLNLDSRRSDKGAEYHGPAITIEQPAVTDATTELSSDSTAVGCNENPDSPASDTATSANEQQVCGEHTDNQ